MACERFKCIYDNEKHECEHTGNFTTTCLDMRCEGHSLCCICKQIDCENNKSKITRAF